MKRISVYRAVIAILLLIICLQWIFIVTAKRPKPPKAAIRPKGKIAIVIDDWGYNLNNLDILYQIKYPLTCSLLPNLNYSQQLAQELNAQGYEIILHLPMEPHERYRLEKDTIMTSMDEATIKNIIARDLANISFAKGVSNHMGSAATEDTRTTKIIFKELEKRRLYFLDSMVSAKSVCSGLARKMGLGFAKRDVFLDNVEEPGYIRGQIYQLKMKARIYGQAIGICHDRNVTLSVLKELMPQIEKEGYKFVFVSQLLRQ